MAENKKIKTREEIRQIAQNLRKQGKKIATINGSFDILHVGHIKMLQEAKKQGDVLILGLNSDSSIKQYKSKDRPINPQEARAEMLAALECIDYITIFDETDPIALLDVIRPDIHVNGSEYGHDCIERPIVEKHGGKIHIVKLVDGYSTTKMIEKIMKVYGNKVKK